MRQLLLVVALATVPVSFAAEPETPRVDASPPPRAALSADAAVPASARPAQATPRFDTLAIEDADVDAVHKEQACEEAAREAVEAQLAVAVRQVRDAREQKWTRLAPDLHACAAEAQPDRRQSCIDAVTAFLDEVSAPVVVPAGTVTVDTACGPRTRQILTTHAVGRMGGDAAGSMHPAAEAMLARLRAGPADGE